MMTQLQKSVKGVSDRLSQLVDQFGEWKARVDSRLPPSRNHEIMSPLGVQASVSIKQELQYVPPSRQ
ncbi:hypothetical protein IG631_23953 [Alternaria alternata]|nr:hypothetical protein IG631_23953 [Alternaria alternata]